MAKEDVLFKGVLFGHEQPAVYIAKLQTAPLFRINVHAIPSVTTIEVIGPLKESISGNYADVFEHCQARARGIGLETMDIAASTAAEIVYADIAEQEVLASPLVLTMTVDAETTCVEFLLSVSSRGPKDTRACISYYADWRMTCVANAMGLQFERPHD
jgi:hypothetical protein